MQNTITLKVLSVVGVAFLNVVMATPRSLDPEQHDQTEKLLQELNPMDHRMARFVPPLWVLEDVLELDDTQLDKVTTLQKEVKTTVRYQFKELRALRGQLKSELEQDEPSSLRVGELVISGRDLRHQMKESSRNFKKSFDEILTKDQLEKHRKFRDRRERRRGSRDFGDRQERRRGPRDFGDRREKRRGPQKRSGPLRGF